MHATSFDFSLAFISLSNENDDEEDNEKSERTILCFFSTQFFFRESISFFVVGKVLS